MSQALASILARVSEGIFTGIFQMAGHKDAPNFGAPGQQRDQLPPALRRWDAASPIGPTYDEMVAAMGTSDASAVIVNAGVMIGQMANSIASKTGININAQDPHLLVQALNSLTPAERRSLAQGATSGVQAKIAGIIEHQAEIAKINKPAANIHGPASDRTAKAGGLEAGQWIGGKWFSADALSRGEGRAARDTSGRFAELTASGVRSGVPASVLTDYSRQYSGMGVNPAAVATFAAIGLDRGTYDGLRREGFNRQQIVRGAQDTKVLGGHGKEDNEITVRASTEAREAVKAHKAAEGALKNAKTDAERAKAQAQLDAMAKEIDAQKKKIDALPDSDPRKQNDQNFYKRYHQTGEFQAQARQNPNAARVQSDAAIIPKALGAARDTQRETIATKAGKLNESAQTALQDDLLGPATPSPQTRQAGAPQPASPTVSANTTPAQAPGAAQQAQQQQPRKEKAAPEKAVQAAAPKPPV